MQALKGKVLIVEDNPVNLKLAKILIQSRFPDLNLLEAFNGMEAVEKYQSELPDLILMDVQMPVMHGLDATRAIRNIEKKTGRHVPVVALTASVIQEDFSECKDSGMDDFVNKPFDKEYLFQTIEKWLKTK